MNTAPLTFSGLTAPQYIPVSGITDLAMQRGPKPNDPACLHYLSDCVRHGQYHSCPSPTGHHHPRPARAGHLGRPEEGQQDPGGRAAACPANRSRARCVRSLPCRCSPMGHGDTQATRSARLRIPRMHAYVHGRSTAPLQTGGAYAGAQISFMCLAAVVILVAPGVTSASIGVHVYVAQLRQSPRGLVRIRIPLAGILSPNR